MTSRKVLLVKCWQKTIFSRLQPIITEPLELEYLGGMLGRNDVDYRIFDELLEGGNFKNIYNSYKPDILVLSGYITAVDVIKKYAAYAKKKNHSVKIIAGGVHAEVNYEDFFTPHIDIIVHSDGINTLERLIKSDFEVTELELIDGIAFRDDENFKINRKINTTLDNAVFPDRSYFYKYKYRTKYLNYGSVAILKSALSCPFNCSFCYCKLLNNGMYSARSIRCVVEEISHIDCGYIWIVDDSFLMDRKRVTEFIDLIEAKNINKRFIAYSRADFIADNEDIIKRLSDIGFIDLIVGMEAVEDSQLNSFNKKTREYENIKTIEILDKYGINLTALFIAGIDFTVRDFKNFRRWIKNTGLKLYTLSIFTPVKGIKDFEEYKNKLITRKPSKWDFLHLVIKPENMSIPAFYFQFYLSYTSQLFTNREVRNLLYSRIKDLLRLGGNHA